MKLFFTAMSIARPKNNESELTKLFHMEKNNPSVRVSQVGVMSYNYYIIFTMNRLYISPSPSYFVFLTIGLLLFICMNITVGVLSAAVSYACWGGTGRSAPPPILKVIILETAHSV